MTRIKICGLTKEEDVDAAVEEGADFVGFNLWRGSKRFVRPHRVRSLTARLPPTVLPVGVFVHSYLEEISVSEYAEIAWIQVHGTPDTWTNEGISRPVIRAVSVGRTLAPEDLPTGSDYWLLDRPQENFGGSGRRFDWSLAEKLAGHPRLFLAGGLTPENVADAVKKLKPYAVDVASGVESAPGVKDRAKMRAFIQAVRGADAA